jgi:hypothetical protein
VLSKCFTVVIAGCLTLGLAGSAWAGLFSAIACTKDHKSVALKIELRPAASLRVQNHIKVAFHNAAVGLTSTDLVTKIGFQAFYKALTEDDLAAIVEIPGPPAIFGECK